MQSAVLALRNELGAIRADGVQMRCEQNGLSGFIFRLQTGEDIGATGQDFLEFHFQPGAGGGDRQKIRDVFFTGVRMAGRQKRRIYAG